MEYRHTLVSANSSVNINCSGRMSMVSCCLHMTGNPSAHVSHVNIHINKIQVGNNMRRNAHGVYLRGIKLKYNSTRRFLIFHVYLHYLSRWTRRLRRRSAAVLLLRLRVRIPPVAWMSVSCECCLLPGKSLCIGLINRSGESYRNKCVWVWWGLRIIVYTYNE